MSASSILLALIVAVVVFVGYMVIVQAAGRRETVKNRIDRLADSYASAREAQEEFSRQTELTPGAAVVEGLLTAMGTNVEAIRREKQTAMTQAGIESRSGFIHYLFMKRIALPVLAVLLLIPLVTGFLNPQTAGMIKIAYLIGCLLVLLLGLKGADLFITNSIAKRKEKLMRAFPDTLDLMLVCVESGLALDGALNRVTRELGRAYPEMTEELNRTRLELTLLNDRSQALQNLADRTDLVPFRAFVSALIQAEKFGTSLSDTLRVMSHDYRVTRLLQAENKAGRLPALMTIPMILLMLPAFLMIIIAPPIIKVAAQGGLFGN